MREIVYKYETRGMYTTDSDTSFNADKELKLIAKPHNFSMKIGEEVLRSTSFGGIVAVVSNDGAVVFYDNDNCEIAKVEKGDSVYKKVELKWNEEFVAIEFGSVVTVDYYPNCDGESDRYGEEWSVQRAVKLNLKDNSIQVM